MTAYRVNKALHRISQDDAFREAVRADPAAALGTLDLEPGERRLLLEGDVASLYRYGVHPFLLFHLARFELCGLNWGQYTRRIKAIPIDEA
jgi:hypothetical protein